MYAEVGQDLIQHNNGASNAHKTSVPYFCDDKVAYAEIITHDQFTVTIEESHTETECHSSIKIVIIIIISMLTL